MAERHELTTTQIAVLKALAAVPPGHKRGIFQLRAAGLLPDDVYSPTFGVLLRGGLIDAHTMFDNGANNPYVYWLTDAGRMKLVELGLSDAKIPVVTSEQVPEDEVLAVSAWTDEDGYHLSAAKITGLATEGQDGEAHP